MSDNTGDGVPGGRRADDNQPQNRNNLVVTIVTVLASLGVVGGGGGYLVNSGISDLGNELTQKIAVMQTEITHVKEAQKTISEKVFDEFKEHVNDPNLHANGLAKLRAELQEHVEKQIDKLREDWKEPSKKQWELISDIKDRLAKIEALIKLLENE